MHLLMLAVKYFERLLILVFFLRLVFIPKFGTIFTRTLSEKCSPYSVQMQGNTDQKCSEYGHFSRSGNYGKCFMRRIQNPVKHVRWSVFRFFSFRKIFTRSFRITRKDFHSVHSWWFCLTFQELTHKFLDFLQFA